MLGFVYVYLLAKDFGLQLWMKFNQASLGAPSWQLAKGALHIALIVVRFLGFMYRICVRYSQKGTMMGPMGTGHMHD